MSAHVAESRQAWERDSRPTYREWLPSSPEPRNDDRQPQGLSHLYLTHVRSLVLHPEHIERSTEVEPTFTF